MAPPAVDSSDASEGIKRGAWSKEEDKLLRQSVETYGVGNWHLVPHRAGLKRCRKSCRLRWLNYLSPKIKRGRFSTDEVDLITRMHRLLGNRWSLIAGRLPGRTANDVKNYWNSRLAQRFSAKPASATTMNAPPTIPRTVVYRPQAHRVSMRTRELLGQMFGPTKPNPNPPAISLQLPHITEKLHPFPALQPSSSHPTELPHPFAAQDQFLSQPPNIMEMPHPFPAPHQSSSYLPWLPAEHHLEELAPTGRGGGGTEEDLFATDVDLFCDSFFLEWIKDDNGSSPLD